MPSWLISLLVQIAVKVGVPWLLTKFPWIPENIVAIIEKLISDLKKPTVSNSAARKRAIAEVKASLQVSPGPQRTKKS